MHVRGSHMAGSLRSGIPVLDQSVNSSDAALEFPFRLGSLGRVRLLAHVEGQVPAAGGRERSLAICHGWHH